MLDIRKIQFFTWWVLASGIGLITYGFMAMPLGSRPYWCLTWTGFGLALLSMAILFPFNTFKKKGKIKEEVLREKIDFWRTWLTTSPSLALTALFGAYAIRIEYPNHAYNLVIVAFIFSGVALVSHIMYQLRHKELIEMLEDKPDKRN